MGRLSTHVLDTARGCPAAGVRIDLYACEGAARRLVKSVATNADGRTEEPLLADEAVVSGVYELVFHAGDYFRALGVALSDPAFLEDVGVRFGLADAASNYHVPLLLSPYGYTTYRGS